MAACPYRVGQRVCVVPATGTGPNGPVHPGKRHDWHAPREVYTDATGDHRCGVCRGPVYREYPSPWRHLL